MNVLKACLRLTTWQPKNPAMKKIDTEIGHLRMLASIKGELWLMTQARLQEFALSALDAQQKVAESMDLSDFFDIRQDVFLNENGVARIQVKGSLLNKSPGIYERLGLSTRYQTIIDETEAAVAMGAKAIIYEVDSPGGTVAGVQEAGAAISCAGIPTEAFCTGLACSAAYWLASQASQITATPSAQVGNIGAILSWTDCSKFWEDAGVEFKALVSEGADLKSTFHLEPNEEQIEFLQEEINEAGAQFKNAVAVGRTNAGVELDPEIWRAGWYSGFSAGELGLIDDLSTSPLFG